MISNLKVFSPMSFKHTRKSHFERDKSTKSNNATSYENSRISGKKANHISCIVSFLSSKSHSNTL